MERLAACEYYVGVVSQRTLGSMADEVAPPRDVVGIFWLGPPYSFCRYAAQRGLDPTFVREMEQAFLSAMGDDEVEQAVRYRRACNNLILGHRK